MEDIDKRQIIASMLRIVDHISDKSYQRRVWIKGEGPEVDDFDETICHFFQGAEGIIDHCKEFSLTEDQLQILMSFRDELQKFSDENDLPELFIDTPQWGKIVQMAKEVLAAFKSKKRAD